MPDVLGLLARELEYLVEPLTRAARSEPGRRELFAALGWELDSLTGFPVDTLEIEARKIAETAAKLAQSAADPPQTLDAAGSLVDEIGTLFNAVRGLEKLADDSRLDLPPDAVHALSTIGAELVEFLLAEYLLRLHPLAYQLARLLTVLRAASDYEGMFTPPIGGTAGQPVLRYAAGPPQIQLDRLRGLIADPVGTLRAEYLGAESLRTPESARVAAGRLFGRLGPLLVVIGAELIDPMDALGAAERDATRTLAFRFGLPEADTGVGAVVSLVADTEGGAGVTVTPSGWIEQEWESRSWALRLKFSGDVAEFTLRRDGVTIPTGTGKLSVEVDIKRLPPSSSQSTVIGASRGTRIELGSVQLLTDLELTANRRDLSLEFELGRSAIVVAGEDGDGFLQEVLPREGLRTDFDLALGWSNQKGLYFRGGAGLETTLPVRSSLLGMLSVDSVYLALHAGDTDIRVVAATTASVKLGPFTANIERMGLLAEFTFPPDGGNLGPANVELDFKPPNGAGLAIDSGVVVGGGYLFFDPENEQYAGVLQLELGGKISLNGIGLLSTRLPDGSRGFSLLVIISAEGFAPIALGFGFTLNGVGGLLGVNRTAMVDTLRAGIKTGTLGSILFPNDPIRNAPKIISDLRTVFPPAPDRYLFGPMAILGWGAPTLLTLEIGLVLELPEPIRLILLGRLKVVLPDEERVLVQLRMDAIGVVDFQKGEISLDATLYDSRILMFALTGDMAMRVSVGERPNFVLSIGGFNPRYAAPPGLQRLSRLALSLATSDNPRLRLEAYLALTSNTVQFGARVELLVRAGPFSLEGFLGFDVLFQFEPFQFIADLSAGVALRYEEHILMSIYLDATLSGPTPWHAYGTASFQILFFKVAIPFNVHFGPEPPPAALPEPVDVVGLLAAAFADARNWSGGLAPGVRPLVSVRPMPDGATTLRVHPLAQLTARQRVAPLNRRIEKFGNYGLEAGARAYTVAAVRTDTGAPLRATRVKDVFALSQFQEMSDDEKLSSPSFETLDSGLRFGSDEFVYQQDPATDGTVGYEQRTIDPGTGDGAARQEDEPHLMSAAVFDAVVGLGAAGQAATRRTGTSRYRDLEPVANSLVI